MSLRLRIFLIISTLIFIIGIIRSIKKNDVNIKYSLIWLFSGILIIIVTIIPNLLEILSKFLGFELVSNMIFLLAILLLLVLSYSFTVILSRHSKRIRLLTQEISILKAEIEQKNNKWGVYEKE